MARRPDIWMPLYIEDWDRDTSHLDCEQDGAYGRLVRQYWKTGPLPDDDAMLSRTVRMERSRWRKVRPTIAAFFEIREGKWFHKRVDEEMARASALSEKRARVGKKGAEERWAGDGRVEGTRSERLAIARSKGTHSDIEWRCLVEAVGSQCVQCRTPMGLLVGGKVCKDHITPIFKGGSDGLDNLQPLCRECNAGKGGDTTDFREIASPGWQERLAGLLEKRLANACQTPAHAGVVVTERSSEVTNSFSIPIQGIDNNSEGVAQTAKVIPLDGRGRR